jgi:hypothetical protein
MDALAKDIRYAWRWLVRSPAFALVAVLSLGLGVGVNTAMFTLVDAVLLRPLPVSSPSTLVDVFTSGGDGDVHRTSSYPDFLDLKTDNTVFSDVSGTARCSRRSAWAIAPARGGAVVTANHFDVLGIRPERGRLLRALTMSRVHRRSWCSPIARGSVSSAAPRTSSAVSYTCVASRTRSSAWRRRRSRVWCRC